MFVSVVLPATILAVLIVIVLATVVLALAIGVITLLTGPSLGANTLFLVIFKIMSELVALGVNG